MSSANASAPYIIAPPARSSARKSARPRLPAVDEDSHSKLTRVNFKCESHREITAQKPVQQPEKISPDADVTVRPELPYYSTSSYDKDIISTSIILKVLLISILSCFLKPSTDLVSHKSHSKYKANQKTHQLYFKLLSRSSNTSSIALPCFAIA